MTQTLSLTQTQSAVYSYSEFTDFKRDKGQTKHKKQQIFRQSDGLQLRMTNLTSNIQIQEKGRFLPQDHHQTPPNNHLSPDH